MYWGAEVDIFDVKAKVSRAICADDTIPQNFGGGGSVVHGVS